MGNRDKRKKVPASDRPINLPGGISSRVAKDAGLARDLSSNAITAEEHGAGRRLHDDWQISRFGKSAPNLGVFVDNSGSSNDSAAIKRIDAQTRISEIRRRIDDETWSILFICAVDGYSITALTQQTRDNSRYLSGVYKRGLNVAMQVQAEPNTAVFRRVPAVVGMAEARIGVGPSRQLAASFAGKEFWWAEVNDIPVVVAVERTGPEKMADRSVTHAYLPGNNRRWPIAEFAKFRLIEKVESPGRRPPVGEGAQPRNPSGPGGSYRRAVAPKHREVVT